MQIYMVPNNVPVCLSMLDYTKWNNETKIEWMRFEVGHEAPLDEFAAKYKELFGDTVCDARQKDLCLKLYREYSKIGQTEDKGDYETVEERRGMAYIKGSQVPPSELCRFERVWYSEAPARCLNCNTAIPEGQRYCNDHK